MTTIINLTPHAIDIRKQDGTMLHIEPTAPAARVDEIRTALPAVGGIGVTRAAYGIVNNLPAPAPDTIYIVSMLVLSQCADRADVFAPGALLRDDAGRPIGCDGLSAAPTEQKSKLAMLLEYGDAMSMSAGHAPIPTEIDTPDIRDWGQAMADSAGHAPIPVGVAAYVRGY